MILTSDTLNTEIWHRRILNGYWVLVAFFLVFEVLFVLGLHHREMDHNLLFDKKYLFSASNLLILFGMFSTELWLRFKKKYHKQAVVCCGFLVSYMMCFVIEPFVDGAQMTLLMPIMVALIYFDRILLYIMGLFSLFFYAGIYFTLERVLLHKPLLEFLIIECVFVVFVVMTQAVILRAREAREHLEQLTKSEQGLMVERAISDKLLKIDALTGLYNHKTFHEYLDLLLEQGESNGLRLQIAILDIDNFKRVNDTYGHWVGDLVLKEVAATISPMIGANDFAARYGGEEFAIIFTDKSLTEAYMCAEELRTSIERMEHSYAGEKPVTVSTGLCNYEPGMGKETLFRKADDALYTAKKNGKNTVVTALTSRGEAQVISCG
ncbi:GGDEF domain-containing protein [Paenibacillus sp. sgz500958]|uniref:GGDEF domain-containing protein n=1 Tax=Paenibacillus sp. sgz500958 TaxID=3242475 RepID=UPI0036D3691A